MEKLIKIITSMTVFSILLVLISIGMVYPTDDIMGNVHGFHATIQFVIMVVYLIYNCYVSERLHRFLVNAINRKSETTSDVRVYVERGWIILVGLSMVSVFYFIGLENTSWLAYLGNALLFLLSALVLYGGRMISTMVRKDC